MTYTTNLWPMIVAAICALLWIFLGVAIMIALKSEKKRQLKHMRRAEKRMRKVMAKKAAFGPAMYPPGTGRVEMIPMGTFPKNRPRDTPKVVPLEDDIIYDNRKSGSEMRRDDGDSRRGMP